MIADPLFVKALIAGSLFALLAAPLGAFVVWRRMAYFGEALAHATLLGVGLGLLLGWAPEFAVIPVMVAVALVFAGLERRTAIPADTLLAILAHGALGLGIVLISAMRSVRVDLMGYLFGDILAIGPQSLLALAGLCAVALAFFVVAWRGLLAAATSEELARVEGVAVGSLRLGLVVVLAIAVAVGMRVVGLLLVMALLVIPVAAVRPFVRAPESLVVAAAACGMSCVLGGLVLAFHLDWPAGPAIAVFAVALFLLGQLSAFWRSRIRSAAP